MTVKLNTFKITRDDDIAQRMTLILSDFSVSKVGSYITVKHPKKSFISGWWMSILGIFSCCASTSTNEKVDERRRSSLLSNVPDRVLKANDRTFNEQFKYAVNFFFL